MCGLNCPERASNVKGEGMAEKRKTARRASPTEFISHWPQLIAKLQYSSQEFYAKIEKALEERKIPDLKFSRVEWPEGGLLSDRREYLRIVRERLTFDVCGAPFGTGFFVSIWCGEKPLKLGVLVLLFCLVALVAGIDWVSNFRLGIYRFLWFQCGFKGETTTMLVLGILAGILVLILVKAGPNLDNMLMGLPVIAYFYERYFRKITYYRFDKRSMYQQAVNAAVMQVIDEICSVQCIKPLSEFDRRPVLRDLQSRMGSHGRY